MEKLFFNGEFTTEGNFRGEDVYLFLDDLKVKMEAHEVADFDKMDFLKRHLSVTAKTIVGSVRDFDAAVSRLIEAYGEESIIIARTMIEANEKMAPIWRRLKRIPSNKRLGERIVVLRVMLSLLNKLKEMSERGKKFKEIIFSPDHIKQILWLVPSKVRNDFVVKCFKNLGCKNETYYMEFQKFMQQEYIQTIEWLDMAPTPYSDLKDVVVEQFKEDATKDADKELDSLSENESSCMEEDADEVKNATDENVQESEDFDEKLLKDKESFAYKLRRLRAQLFEENVNGSMSSSSVKKYEKMVKKFVSKFKHY